MAVEGVGGEAAGRDRMGLGSSYTKSSEKGDKSHGYLTLQTGFFPKTIRVVSKEFGEV